MFGKQLLWLLLSSLLSLIHGSSYFAEHIIVGHPRRDCMVLSTAENKCPISQFPDSYGPMVGGQVESRPTVCVKGRDYGSMSKCYQYMRRRWVKTFELPESIMAGTSAQINNGSDMWVASGWMTPKNTKRLIFTTKTFIVKSPTDIRPGIDLPYTSHSPHLLHFSGEKVFYIAAPTIHRFNTMPINIIDLADANPKWTSLTPYTMDDPSTKLTFVIGTTSTGTYLYVFEEQMSYYQAQVFLTSKFFDLNTNQWSAGPSVSDAHGHFITSNGPAMFFQGDIYMFGQSVNWFSPFEPPAEIKDEEKVDGMHFPLENGSGKWTPIKNMTQNKDVYFNSYVTCSGIVDC